MRSQDVSEEISHLSYAFIKVLIEKTDGELKMPLKFEDVYNDACTKQGGNNNTDEENTEVRQHVRDNLLENGYIFVDPKEVDYIFLTQKAIDEYSDY
ncbi:MAG TPA: hypothetical protein VD815_11105 [Candidatus Saccharimonadales bacterium]|nr:hypothetical protein [Candidatus Saccharimonadales bacterium]